jgi:F420-dependent oxidoreductase-like protein
VDLGVMIEGQEGLDWPLWRRIATETEALGFESLWRSDHFFSLSGPREQPALETFVSLALAAEVTSRIRFGPLVASMTFRHPSLLARMAAQVDALSDGRFICGVGAGWNVPEHEAFGLPFPSVRERMDRLDEGIRVLKALWGDEPTDFEGEHFQLRSAICYPKPAQRPLPLLVGGRGERRTLRIVAEHADEWNAVGVDLEAYRHKRQVLERHCADVGRDPASIRHSQMCGFVIGRDEAEQRRHLGLIAEKLVAMQHERPEAAIERLRGAGWLIGTPGEIVEDLGRRQEAGLSRVMLQHHANDRFDVLELVAAEVLPQVQR